MINFVALPLVVTLLVVLVGSRRLDQLHPATAARLSVILLAAISVATIPTLWLIGLSGLAHAGFHNPVIDWSQHLLPDHAPFGAIVGIASLITAAVGTVRVGRVLLHHRRIRCTDTCPIEFVDTDEVYAYTLPGPARTIAVSHGLRRTLDEREYEIVIAHERAHATHRHDRYKLVALVTTAFVPVTEPVARRLDFYLERWADEEAVAQTGTERRRAARTIAKVALARTSPSPALGIADLGVAARATALLEPEISRSSMIARCHATAVASAVLALTLYQFHHSVIFAAELAP